jgi:hypothetical protein
VSNREEQTVGAPCFACRKFSDAAKTVKGTTVTLCGTDYDLWLKSAERSRVKLHGVESAVSEFLRRRTAEILNATR